jgi:hypothetical protein
MMSCWVAFLAGFGGGSYVGLAVSCYAGCIGTSALAALTAAIGAAVARTGGGGSGRRSG